MRKKAKLSIGLLVLHCKDIESTRQFYEQLGLGFSSEKHGKGPQHYVWEDSGFVLELYPSSDRHPPEMVRLGFTLPFLADLSGDILHNSGIKVLETPYVAGGRLTMLVEDPDGRKVEIGQALHS